MFDKKKAPNFDKSPCVKFLDFKLNSVALQFWLLFFPTESCFCSLRSALLGGPPMTHGRIQLHRKSSNGKSQDYTENEDEDNGDDNSWPARLVPQERNFSGDLRVFVVKLIVRQQFVIRKDLPNTAVVKIFLEGGGT